MTIGIEVRRAGWVSLHPVIRLALLKQPRTV
jgi:hypothetical protein